jgi:hypothetical protein
MTLREHLPLFVLALVLLIGLGACSSNDNDPYWLAYEGFREAKKAHPKDAEYVHPDFEKAIAGFEALPGKGSQKWVKAQRLAERIREKRKWAMEQERSGSGAIDVRDDEAAVQLTIKSLLDSDPGSPSASPSQPSGKKARQEQKPPPKVKPEPAAPTPAPPPDPKACKEACFQAEPECKIRCGCTRVGQSLMCNDNEVEAPCLTSCEKARQECLGPC